MSARGAGGGLRWLLVAVGVVVLVLGVWLAGRASAHRPFDVRSAAPEGYRALALLLEQSGREVRQGGLASALDGGPDDAVVVVARPDLVDDDGLERLDQLASGGATVVLGTAGDAPMIGDPFGPDARTIADTEAVAVAPGECDVAGLVGLGPIDAAFSVAFVPDPSAAVCYSDGVSTEVAVSDVGEGRVVTLSDPSLWANARLQPAKEQGGAPLDNAAMALALLEGAGPVTFVEPVPAPGASLDGTEDPLSLLPRSVQLALAQLLAAAVLYLWWRGRRLGPLPEETLPVEIAGSELVAAVGDLSRRRRSRARAAAVLRAGTRRQLAERLGLGPEPPPQALIDLVAVRTGRDAEDVGAALFDHLAPVPTDDASLVRLARTLDSIRQEVLDEPARA